MAATPRLRFSLRALLVLVTLCAIALAWIHGARQQQAAVNALLVSNPSADVYYDGSTFDAWAMKTIGADYVANVIRIDLEYPTDADIAYLVRLPRLERVGLDRGIDLTDEGLRSLSRLKHLRHLTIVDAEQITDAGLRHLEALTSLRYLRLDRGRFPISRETLESLRRALPRCRIEVGGPAKVVADLALKSVNDHSSPGRDGYSNAGDLSRVIRAV